ncbi:type II toxin-antitoxin system VapC family toxin [Coraliomargarita parva]|uniref:type II toxin-antitoxin system VapC family toxin n=1 Tax=Coraliomargarita parva TaxID=3014050 RepID=UPI0022B3D5EA|nr:type II toxin-antitoxin system VapC family toxin [Coraliomargarita parva]
MEQSVILETSFLIDFERERHREPGPAMTFLRAHRDWKLYLTHTIAGELASGMSLSNRENWRQFIQPFQILSWDERVDWEYGQAYRFLQANGLLIGGNDLWIAATALAHGCPVVTANQEHFGRVPNLEVWGYR